MPGIYFFGNKLASDTIEDLSEQGNKGLGLIQLSKLGLPIPEGFIISSVESLNITNNCQELPEKLKDEIKIALSSIEKITQKRFGDVLNPLLVSVRAGSRISMPGMMDTILNVGINDKVVESLISLYNNPLFAWDCYRRFIRSYSISVMNINPLEFEEAISKLKVKKGFQNDSEFSGEDLRNLVSLYKEVYLNATETEFPQDPYEHLFNTIFAVFRSWNGQRAKKYRQIHNISNLIGTAVNVCEMIFGNLNAQSGTGVCFTRNPSSGENNIYGEFLLTAQGEDVVAGLRTPQAIEELKQINPKIYEEISGYCKELEKFYRDVQDLEFTIQDNKLFILQTRTAKRAAIANIRIAIDFVKDGIISEQEAILRILPQDFEKLLQPVVDVRQHKQVLAKGLPASPGAAAGRIVFSTLTAEYFVNLGQQVILLREETSPEDIGGIFVAQGLLTIRGGMTCHAAIVARQMGKTCITGCSTLEIDELGKKCFIGELELLEGEWITLDGTTGEVILGKVATREAIFSEEFSQLVEWLHKYNSLNIKVNCDDIHSAKIAKTMGVAGIGIYPTEKLFFDSKNLSIMQEVIITTFSRHKTELLEKILPTHTEEMYNILKEMNNYPIAIRLFDHQFSSFLPQNEEEIEAISKRLNLAKEELSAKIKLLKQSNPAFGHRGCRIGITHPEIYEMQVRSIIDSVIKLRQENCNPIPKIIIPFVSSEEEFLWLKNRMDSYVKTYLRNKYATHPAEIGFEFGIIIETPRAAFISDKLAKNIKYIIYNTNNLTQSFFGLSRDDRGYILKIYKNNDILNEDPFEKLDIEVLGSLIRMSIVNAKKANNEIHIGICGDQLCDKESIRFFLDLQVDFIGVHLTRLPMVLLNSAQENLLRQDQD